MAKKINYTRLNEDYTLLKDLSDKDNYFKYQKMNVKSPEKLPSHIVIKNHIKEFGIDYRFETQKNPFQELQDRKTDNVTVARKK